MIIDTAPVLPAADTAVLSRYVDASILVVDASKTKRADVTLVFEQLELAGAPIVGTVLNKVRRRSGLFGSGYGYGYGGYQADGCREKVRTSGLVLAQRGRREDQNSSVANEIPHIEGGTPEGPWQLQLQDSHRRLAPRCPLVRQRRKTRTATSVREANEKARSESSPMTQPLVVEH